MILFGVSAVDLGKVMARTSALAAAMMRCDGLVEETVKVVKRFVEEDICHIEGLADWVETLDVEDAKNNRGQNAKINI